MKAKFLILLFMVFMALGQVSLVTASSIMKITDETPSSITIHDSKDRIVTIQKPVDRIAVIDELPQVASTLQAIGAYGKVIALDDRTAREKVPSPEKSNVTSIGKGDEPDIEKLVTLKPDLILVGMYASDEKIKKLESAGLTVVAISLFPTVDEGFSPTDSNTRILGSIVGDRKQADAFSDWRRSYLDKISEKVQKLPDSERPKTIYTYKWKDNSIFGAGSGNRIHYVLSFIGADDINKDIAGDWTEVDLEHVIKDNPSFILFEEMDHKSGYGIRDTGAMSSSIASLKKMPGLDKTDAVQKDQIYGLPVSVLTGDTWLAAIYLAPVIHPDTFGDLHPEKIHREYLEKFLNISPDLVTDGVFLYPSA